jgi:hypothetical protein
LTRAIDATDGRVGAAFGVRMSMEQRPPPILHILENISFPEQLSEMRAFFSGSAASGFRLFIDSACALPSNWQESWASPKQWGVTGNQHWATKYGAQGFIPKMITNSPFVTTDWRQASASVVVLFARHYAGGPAIVQQQCLQRLRQRSDFFIFTDSRGPCCLDGKYKEYVYTLLQLWTRRAAWALL